MMIGGSIDGVLVTPLNVITTPGGNVLHGMKADDSGYSGFGEAYFSFIGTGVIKGWKRHNEMVLNLVVPIGVVRFVIFDDRKDSNTLNNYQEISLSQDNYKRLTVPPMVWMAFQGVGQQENMLLNVASIPHEPYESDLKPLEELPFTW